MGYFCFILRHHKRQQITQAWDHKPVGYEHGTHHNTVICIFFGKVFDKASYIRRMPSAKHSKNVYWQRPRQQVERLAIIQYGMPQILATRLGVAQPSSSAMYRPDALLRQDHFLAADEAQLVATDAGGGRWAGVGASVSCFIIIVRSLVIASGSKAPAKVGQGAETPQARLMKCWHEAIGHAYGPMLIGSFGAFRKGVDLDDHVWGGDCSKSCK